VGAPFALVGRRRAAMLASLRVERRGQIATLAHFHVARARAFSGSPAPHGNGQQLCAMYSAPLYPPHSNLSSAYIDPLVRVAVPGLQAHPPYTNLAQWGLCPTVPVVRATPPARALAVLCASRRGRWRGLSFLRGFARRPTANSTCWRRARAAARVAVARGVVCGGSCRVRARAAFSRGGVARSSRRRGSGAGSGGSDRRSGAGGGGVVFVGTVVAGRGRWGGRGRDGRIAVV